MVLTGLKNLREDNDLNQSVLASELGVAQNTYSQYENGIISISPEALVKLADYFDVSVDYLLGRTKVKEMNK